MATNTALKQKQAANLALLLNLIPDLAAWRIGSNRKFIAPEFMDLCAEIIDAAIDPETGKRHIDLSLAHYGRQNGDAMRDPEMIVRLRFLGDTAVSAQAFYFRNDYTSPRATEFDPDRGSVPDLDKFLNIWLRNIKAQGHRPIGQEAA